MLLRSCWINSSHHNLFISKKKMFKTISKYEEYILKLIEKYQEISFENDFFPVKDYRIVIEVFENE